MALRVGIIGSTTATGAPTWRDDELQAIEKNFLEEGVVSGFAVSEHGAGANMSVDVALGTAIVEITNSNLTPSNTYKVYFTSDGTEVIPVTTADATNPRIDRLILEVLVNANPNSASSNIASMRLVAGTPAGSPSAPAEPSNSITLALISVPASDTTIGTAQITDSRTYVTVKSAVLADIARATETAALRNDTPSWLGTITGTNTLTGTPSPAPTAYVTGQRYAFVVANANSGAVTLNVNSLGAKSIKRLDGATALVTGDLKVGQLVEVRYDGTNFQMMTPGATAPSATNYFVAGGSTTQVYTADIVSNTTAETAFTTKVAMVANALVAVGDRIVVDLVMSFYKNGAPSVTIKIKYGSAIMVTHAWSPDSASVARFQCVITPDAVGASGSLNTFTECYVDSPASRTTVFNQSDEDGDRRLTGFNTTTAQDITVTATWSAVHATNKAELIHLSAFRQLKTAA